MKNTENATIPMSGRRYVVFNPRRLSGNWSKQLRNEASRALSTRTRVKNRTSRPLRIPNLSLERVPTQTVAFWTHLAQTIPAQTRLNRIENCCEGASNSHFDFRRFEGLGIKLHQEGVRRSRREWWWLGEGEREKQVVPGGEDQECGDRRQLVEEVVAWSKLCPCGTPKIIANVADGMDCEGEQVQGDQNGREVLFSVAEAVFEVVALVFEDVEGFVLNLP